MGKAAPERFQVGEGLYVQMADVAAIQEQDLNAQVMQPQDFARLTENIRGRGQLESLPYCHQPNGEGPISIVSGHHRSRAARAAGLKQIPILVDTRNMSRSEITAKQIAHNQLHGQHDDVLLRQLLALIDSVDDTLATGLPEDYLPPLDDENPTIGIPAADFQWNTVNLTFLPKQMTEFEEAIKMIETSDLVGVATYEQFKTFAETCYRYGRLKNIKSIATTIHMLTVIAANEIAAAEQGDTNG